MASKKVSRSVYSENFALLKAEMGISRNIPLLQSPLCESPMLMGLFAPCILLPQGYTDDAPELAMILRHELCHYKRHDIAYQFLLVAVCGVYWYNPLVWLMARCARADIELSCDENVTLGKDKAFRVAYGDALINSIQYTHPRRVLLSTRFAGKASVKARLDGIFASSAKKRGAILLAMLLSVSLIASAFVACAPVAPVSTASRQALVSTSRADNSVPENHPSYKLTAK